MLKVFEKVSEVSNTTVNARILGMVFCHRSSLNSGGSSHTVHFHFISMEQVKS